MKVAVAFGGSVSPDFKSWYAKGKEKYLFNGDTIHTVYNPIFNYCYLNKKINFFSSPHDIEYVYDNFYTEVKDNAIFAYLPNPIHRRGKTIEFAEYIGKKYNIPVVRKPFTNGSNDAIHMSWEDFTNLWSPCLWHFNLDPSELQQGQHIVAVANVGSINIGGMNESHKLLFPETATCDLNILEEKFVEYYAWNKLNELYSIDVVKKQLLNML